MSIEIRSFFDATTSTLTYVVFDPTTFDAVIIDPVWDFDITTGQLSTKTVDPVILFLQDRQLRPHFVMETHAHADHLSGSQLF